MTRHGSIEKYLAAMSPKSRRRGASVESGKIEVQKAPTGVGYVEKCPLPSRLGCPGSGVRGGAPAGNTFWHILKDTECSFLHLYADASSSSNSSVLCHIWGEIAPRPKV